MIFKAELKKLFDELPEYRENEFDLKIGNEKEIYIYGAGFMGCKYAEILSENGFCILGLFETNLDNVIKNGYSIKKVTWQERKVIISSAKYYTEMKETLLGLGYQEKDIISPWAVFDNFLVPRFEAAFALFDDDLSKKTIIDKIRYLLLDPQMVPVSKYFDGEMFDADEEAVFIDGGSYDGETTKEFINLTSGKYKKIYCFEPTKSNYEMTVENLKQYPRIEVINKGLFSREDTLKFKDFGVDQWNAVEDFFMGHEWKGPAMEYRIIDIPVTSLDLYFADKPVEEYPTIIKLDIEGSEKEALIGMKHVLNTSHPKLIICAYHKIEDYYELSQTIKEICPDYQLRLRHYEADNLESIIFAKYNAGEA